MLSRIISQPKRIYPALVKLNFRSFTNRSKGPQQNQNSTQQESTDSVYDLINADPNLRSIRDHLVKELTVVQQTKAKKDPTTRELRDSILFEEILRKESDIAIYDCNNYFFWGHYFGNMLLLILGFALAYYYSYAPHINDKKRWLYVLPGILFGLGRIKYYRNFQRYFVESVVYHTKDKSFSITKRGFLFGKKYTRNVPRNEILYTEDEYLNKQKINYINMKTLDLYCIGYKFAWKNQDLFSHLISQRIKSMK